MRDLKTQAIRKVLADVARATSHRRLEWLIPTAVCAIMLAQLLLTSRQLSQTADEATHLYSGYRYLKCGDLTVSPEHPPLAKAFAAAPLLLLNFTVDCAPFKGDALQQAFASLNWMYTQNWPAAVPRTRAAAGVFALGLCVLVWIGARRMFNVATAIVASVLLIFEPNVLAYSSLVLTDIPVTSMLLLAVLGFYLWVKHRTVPLFLLTAVAAGLTLLTKNSGVVVLPILGLLAIADALMQTDCSRSKWQLALRNLSSFALICMLAAGIVWMAYGMRFASYSASTEVREPLPPMPPDTGRVLFGLERYHLLPKAYLRGFAWALEIPGQTSVAFVAGKVYPHAPWFSTPFNFVIRSTAAMLVMMVAALLGMAITFRQRRRERLFLFVPGAVYLAVCLHASSDVSIRYLLPMIPFLLLAVADGCVQLAKRVGRLSYALPCLIVLHMASSLHAYPNYLSYANDLWGGPAQAYKYVPWLDIGQAYPEAKAYLERHPAENCWFITGWQWDPRFYGVPCQTFGLYLPNQIPPRVRGTIIVSSTLLRDVRIADAGIAEPFRNAAPIAQIGGSALLVYEGDFDTSVDAAAGENNLAMRELSAGHPLAALEHGNKAVQLAPTNPLVHANLCLLLAPTQIDVALKECYSARNSLLADPFRYEDSRKKHLESIETSIAALTKNYRSVYGREPNIAEYASALGP